MLFTATYLVNQTRRELHRLPQFKEAPKLKTLLYLEQHNGWNLGRDEIYIQCMNSWLKREYDLDNYKQLKDVPSFWD